MTEEIIIDVTKCDFNTFDGGGSQRTICTLDNCYCDGIRAKDCYFKQLKRLEQENRELKGKYSHVLELAKLNADSNEYCLQELEQENKELKSRVNGQWKLLEQCGINSGGELRRAGYIINDFVQLSNNYRSALEEIREIVMESKPIDEPISQTEFTVRRMDLQTNKLIRVLAKINEVLGNENN